MDPRPLIIACLLALAPLCAAGQEFRLEDPPAQWEEILSALVVTRPMEAEFTEYRRNPFHRNAMRFAGTIRWAPGHGLSIGYSEPVDIVLQITGGELFLSRKGATEQLRMGGDQQEVLLLFAKLFEWDRQWLAARFLARGEIQPAGAWRLVLSPHAEAIAKSISSISLDGDAGRLSRILVGLPGGRSVDIRMDAPRFLDAFSEEVLRSAFPSTDE